MLLLLRFLCVLCRKMVNFQSMSLFLHAITTYDMLADITEPKKMLHNYLV